ncbi:small RNA 2'-O-methyltransferase-like isoform X1 [Carex littledalei]|uniref:Small RNA 2'-O-methyltransferase n=1 Tax=Carex littledalei TaxID=544730 RepID=A0A833QTF0_9POAL|nr:small RNA 2'-O-methyltransferase-like isoform X1 [Carex littledalei]
MVTMKQPATPKAIIHQKFGSKACYQVEEVADAAENLCPGLAIPQQTKIQYRCVLKLPDLTVSSGTFSRKKDAEQSAAQIAVEKLGIEANEQIPTPEGAFDELIARLNILFTDEFLLSTHPLVGHLRVALKREGSLFGLVPISAIAICDSKVNSMCKLIDSRAESDPSLLLSLISKAAKASTSLSTRENGFLIQRQNPVLPEAMEVLVSSQIGASNNVEIEVVRIPVCLNEEVKRFQINVPEDGYYLDVIAKYLEARDSSHILASRTIGKASSEMRFYFTAPQCLFSSSAKDVVGATDFEVAVNKRASYISGQTIYGDAILANIGYTWRSSNLLYEDVSLCTYYRILLGQLPDGYYKLSREAVLTAELPSSYSRATWRGSVPKDLLSLFCRNHRLYQPVFSVQKVASSQSNNTNSDNTYLLRCEVRILSRREELLIVCSFPDTYRKEADAIQNSAMKVLNWFKVYFTQLYLLEDELHPFGIAPGECFKLYPKAILEEFSLWTSIFAKSFCNYLKPKRVLENGVVLLDIEGLDSGVIPTVGSVTSVSYEVWLVREGEEGKRYLVEKNEEFEFEVGSGAVIYPMELCVTQLSLDQSAKFTVGPPPREVILAATHTAPSDISKIPLQNCWLEYAVKVLRVAAPMEERMETALFSPPLSKQRVEFAVRHINQSHALSLVDFGCGSGSLLDSLLDHNTCLEKLVGVDISVRSLTRAAKVLHQKLSKNCPMRACLRSAVLYDGSIMDFDARLYNFDIGTCLEVIEHMEEEQAQQFGDIALSKFCPKILIVSTPNYEYNPILQRSSLPNKEEDPEEKEKPGPCKFRNHDHKFEWTRGQFEKWANDLATKHGYGVEFSGVGGSGDEPGFASQIAVFKRGLSSKEGSNGSIGPGSFCSPYELVWEWCGGNKERGD